MNIEHTIRAPDDMHLHLREGEMLRRVAPLSAASFKRGIVMPNTKRPILTGADALAYKAEIKAAAPNFEPLMTIKLIGSTTKDIILRAKGTGVIAGKFYPEGVTTNSEDGVRNVRDLYPVFEVMQECGMVLCLHGEAPDSFCMDREIAFLMDVEEIAESFPQLKIVLEHITTSRAAQLIFGDLYDNLAATITVHHLLLTLDDVVGDRLQPHHFCKPIAKRPGDRDALLQLGVLSEKPKFFLGTDSAPHTVETKECASGCAGIFSAPVAMGVLAEIFDENNALDKLENFTSVNGAKFYGLPLNEERITLVKEPWRVPSSYGPVVPFKALHAMSWKVK